MDNQNQKTKDELVSQLLENFPIDAEVSVEIPSKNKLGSLIDPTKPITIRCMTFEDEKALAALKTKADSITTVLSRCVSNINISELLSADKLFLLLKLRELSYGDKYGFEVACSHCGASNKGETNLSELQVKYAPDDFSRYSTIELTGIKKKAKVKLALTKDEVYFKDSETLMNNLWRFVEDIDGVNDKSVISDVLKKLPSKDVKKIVKNLSPEIGVDTTISFNCASCSKNNIVSLPITSDFFSES